MAELSSSGRSKIPKSKFGIPTKAKTANAKKQSGNYPMPDKSHAANAKARATQAVNAGRMSASQGAAIKAKANKILGKGKS